MIKKTSVAIVALVVVVAALAGLLLYKEPTTIKYRERATTPTEVAAQKSTQQAQLNVSSSLGNIETELKDIESALK